MEMTGERMIAADRQSVWAALNDPDVLKACISGCKDLEKTSETGFTAKVVQKVGPVKATFTGEVELSDIVEGESYTISGKGKGGAAGGASGGAAVRLEDTPEGTRLTYEAEAKVTGKIAQLGGRLIDGFAKKMADDFFTKFQEQVEGSGASASGDTDAQNDAGSDRIDMEMPELKDAAGEAATTISDQAGKVAADAAAAATDAAEQVAEAGADAMKAAEPAKKGFWQRLFGS